MSTAAEVACDEQADAVGNSGRTAVARFDRTGNTVGTRVVIPMTRAPEAERYTVSESLYWAYIVPKQDAANTTLGDTNASTINEGTASRLIALLNHNKNKVNELHQAGQTRRLSIKELQTSLDSTQGSSRHPAVVAYGNARGLRAEIAAQVRTDLANNPTKVLVNLGNASRAPITPAQVPGLQVITVDGQAPHSTAVNPITANTGREMPEVRAKIQELGGDGGADVVVWNQSLIWGQGTARSTLAERLQQAAALLRSGGVAYLGEMEAALMSTNLNELRQAAAQAGLVMDGKLTVLERADKSSSGVVLRFVKQ